MKTFIVDIWENHNIFFNSSTKIKVDGKKPCRWVYVENIDLMEQIMQLSWLFEWYSIYILTFFKKNTFIISELLACKII